MASPAKRAHNARYHYARRACKGKIRLGRIAATLAAINMARIHGGDFSAYKCEICGAYHVGHSK